MSGPLRRAAPRAVLVALVSLLALGVPVAAVHAAEAVRASLSDLRPSASTVEGTLIIRGNKTLVVDPKSVTATIGGS